MLLYREVLYVTGLILIRGARQLLTLRGPSTQRRGSDLNQLSIIPQGAVLIADGVLRQIGPSRRVENLAEARYAVEINASGKVVMPCFVDCHTHLAYPPPEAGEEEHAEASRALDKSSGKRILSRWRSHLDSMARHGTGTAEIKTGAGPDLVAEYKLLRTLAKLKCQALDVVSTLLFRLPAAEDCGAARCAEFTELVCRDLLPKIYQRKLARFADLAWDPLFAHQALFRRYLSAASALRIRCHMQADRHQTAAAIVMAMEHKAVSVSHLEQATSSDASLMAGSGIIATLLPCASFHTAAGNPPARALIEAGVAIALGSNFHPHCSPTLNMQTVVALACMRLALTPAEAITAATINGAHALGCARTTGSLEPGKSADVAILNISDYRELASHFGTNLVHTTLKRGAVIYREGEVSAPAGPREVPVLH